MAKTVKFDSGKIPLGKLIEDHPAAFDLLGLVRNYAVSKYLLGSGWRTVEDNAARSIDSVYRHISTPFCPDEESGLPHLSHGITQLLICCEFERDQNNIRQGIDPIRELYGPENFADLAARQKANQSRWAEAWNEEKALILGRGKPLLTNEALLDYRLTMNEMAQAYVILNMREPDSLQDLGYCLSRVLECYKNRTLPYQNTPIANDVAATFFAVHALEIKYKNKPCQDFIRP